MRRELDGWCVILRAKSGRHSAFLSCGVFQWQTSRNKDAVCLKMSRYFETEVAAQGAPACQPYDCFLYMICAPERLSLAGTWANTLLGYKAAHSGSSQA